MAENQEFQNRATSDHELLVRIDERMRLFHEHIDLRVKKLEDTRATKDELKPIKDRLNETVSKKELRPVKAIVYGAVSVVGTTVLVAVLGTIVGG